jgi:hypothetical protein
MFNDDDFDGYDDGGYDAADDIYSGTAIDGPPDEESDDDGGHECDDVEVTGNDKVEGPDVEDDHYLDDDPYDNRHME